MFSRKSACVLSIVLCALILGCFGGRAAVPSSQASGVLDPSSDPVQSDAPATPIVLSTDSGSFTLTPRASYIISAKIASKKYYDSGWEAEISPMDLALTWGRMVEPEVAAHVSYSQSGRWYYYRYDGGTQVDKSYIISHSSNNHLIPSNQNVRSALDSLTPGQTVQLEGYLVDIDGKYAGRNVWWRTSQRRGDTASGSCEIFYVQKVRKGDDVYT